MLFEAVLQVYVSIPDAVKVAVEPIQIALLFATAFKVGVGLTVTLTVVKLLLPHTVESLT